MSMFDAQAIPESLISRTAEGDPASATNVERTLGILQAYSLISPRQVTTAPLDEVGRLFDLHRLVRLVTRNWLSMCSMYDYWVAEAVEMMATRYDELEDSDLVLGWVRSNYLSHALALISSPPLLLNDDDEVFLPSIFHDQILHDDHTDKGVICPTCTAHILALMVRYSFNVTQNLRMIRKAVKICTIVLGPTHVVTLSHRSRELRNMTGLDDHVKAESFCRALLVDCESTLGANHCTTLSIAIRLACSLRDQGKYHEAEPLLLALIDTCKQEYGQKHGTTLDAMQGLSRTLILQGRGEEAMKLNFEISDSEDTWGGRVQLAMNYLDLHEYSKAKATYLSLLGDQNIGKRIPDLSTEYDWHLLGLVYLRQSILTKAEGCFLQVLRLRQEDHGEHSMVRVPKSLSLDAFEDGVGSSVMGMFLLVTSHKHLMFDCAWIATT